MEITVTDNDYSMDDFLNSGFAEYGESQGIHSELQLKMIKAEQDGAVIGVLTFIVLYGSIYIDDLLIKPEYRRQGLGKQLLGMVEEYGRSAGVKCISLNTFRFQAPVFYEKCGYQLEYIRKDRDKDKLDRYYFCKYL